MPEDLLEEIKSSAKKLNIPYTAFVRSVVEDAIRQFKKTPFARKL